MVMMREANKTSFSTNTDIYYMRYAKKTDFAASTVIYYMTLNLEYISQNQHYMIINCFLSWTGVQ